MTQQKSTYSDVAPLIGRILLAVLFVFSGFGKMTAAQPTIAYIASAGLPFAPLGLVIAIAAEVGGGILLVLGLFTRPVALILAVFTIATAVFFHANFSDQNMLIHFLKNVSIAGGFLQVFAFGPGRFSLDARRKSAT